MLFNNRPYSLGLLCCLAVCFGAAVAQDADVRELIRQKTERMQEGDALQIEESPIAAVSVIPAFYERREFRPAWTDPVNVDALFTAIRESEAEGLDPTDFHIEKLERLRPEIDDSGPSATLKRASYDVLMTDAAFRLSYQLFYGKVNPEDLDSSWNLRRPLLQRDAVDVLQSAMEAREIPKLFRELTLDHPSYIKLKSALTRYRGIQRAGGWQPVPDGMVLKPGMEDTPVEALRRRLEVTGDYVGEPEKPALFDDRLEEAVKAFQARHGLTVDGVVGRATFAALNVPVEARVDQIRVNLERDRWVMRDIDDDYIVVNIAGFHAYLVLDGVIVWDERAIVGRPYRKTPVFKGEMSHLVFNPTWTVPPGILRKDVLPSIRKDQTYLTKKNFRVVDRDGRRVDPFSIDWAAASPRGFPYQIVQAPGPDNALGLVKFMFPNQHLVYLHDTPSRALFERTERAFSSGCIRLRNPFELADLLLDGGDEWSRDRIDQTIESGQTLTVFLPRKIPVLLLYWTVELDPAGNVRFFRDLYDRDKALLDALDGDFRPGPLKIEDRS